MCPCHLPLPYVQTRQIPSENASFVEGQVLSLAINNVKVELRNTFHDIWGQTIQHPETATLFSGARSYPQDLIQCEIGQKSSKSEAPPRASFSTKEQI